MPQAITEQSTIACSHQGQVLATAGQSKLKVSGALALVDGDVPNAKLAPGTCANVGTGLVPCTALSPLPGGVASRLKVDGRGVLLADLTGTTNSSTVPGTFSVSDAGQTRLQAV
jgi:hypothetical protein